MKGSHSTVVVAGCGYTGHRLAHVHLSSADRVIALTHQTTTDIQGVEKIRIDLDAVESSRVSVEEGALVYYLVPPPNTGQADTRISQFLNHCLLGRPSRLVLISTTGVYGDCGGNWVDESAPTNPETDRAMRRLNAEHVCQEWAKQNEVSFAILRVAAIYGPGRIPVKRVKRGMILPTEEETGYTNRIHVDDLVSVCLAAANALESGIFNVADGHPLRMGGYYRLIAEIWGLPPIQESSDSVVLEEMSATMRGYLRESRRIDNSRILSELGVTLRYPNARTGLESCFRESMLKDA